MFVAGLSRQFSMEDRSKIPELWMQFVPSLGKIPSQVGKSTYGVCYGGDAKSFQYMAAVEVQKVDELPSGFTHLKIPAQRYAVFNHTKHASLLPQTLDAIYRKWLPHSGLQAADGPALERYTEDFCPDKPGGIEVWIPVKA
jgi:AraC family transcriptional regulator